MRQQSDARDTDFDIEVEAALGIGKLAGVGSWRQCAGQPQGPEAPSGHRHDDLASADTNLQPHAERTELFLDTAAACGTEA